MQAVSFRGRYTSHIDSLGRLGYCIWYWLYWLNLQYDFALDQELWNRWCHEASIGTHIKENSELFFPPKGGAKYKTFWYFLFETTNLNDQHDRIILNFEKIKYGFNRWGPHSQSSHRNVRFVFTGLLAFSEKFSDIADLIDLKWSFKNLGKIVNKIPNPPQKKNRY